MSFPRSPFHGTPLPFSRFDALVTMIVLTIIGTSCHSVMTDNTQAANHQVGTAYVRNTDVNDSDAGTDSGDTDLRDTVREETVTAVITTAAGCPESLQGLTNAQIDLITQARDLHTKCIDAWTGLLRNLWLRDHFTQVVHELPAIPKTNDDFVKLEEAKNQVRGYDVDAARRTNDVAKLSSTVTQFLTAHPDMRSCIYSSAPPEGWDPLFNTCFTPPVPQIGGLN